MHRNRFATLMAPAVLGSLVILRLCSLLLRPIHHDEGVNAWFVDNILNTGFYKYDPTNYHGPSLFYLGFLTRLIVGDNLWSLRLVPALGSCLAIIILYNYRKYIGVKAVWAALAMASSTGYFYYSRYFFHESLLVLSLVVANLGFVQAFYGDKKGWLFVWIGGLSAFATKETAAIHTLAILGAFAFLCLDKEGFKWIKIQIAECNWRSTYKPIVVGLICFFILFSGFFYNLKGMFDIFKAFMPWLNTGVVGNGHEKPWYYWLELMKIYEWPMLLGFVGCFIAVFKSRDLVMKFLCSQAILVLIGYSLIPYKTPWCVPSVIWCAAIGFGYFIESVLQRSRVVSAALVLLFMSFSLFKLYDLNFKNYAKIDEPYVYVQSTQEYGEIMSAFDTAAEKQPRFHNELIECQLSSQWPLPWVWRHFTNIKWTVNTDKPEGKIIILDEDKLANMMTSLPRRYYWKKLIARGGVWSSYVFIEKSTAAEYGLEQLTAHWNEAGGSL